MIYKIKGKLIKKEEERIIVETNGIFYEIGIPKTVFARLNHGELSHGEPDMVELVIYHYFNMSKNKGIPVLIGFSDELERDFFEKFISVSGVGPRAALRAFDKPVPVIAQAIEEGNVDFLKTLIGIGAQRAKQIVAQLQGKVGRFALLKEAEYKKEPLRKKILEEAKEILKRLQYNSREADIMIKRALECQPQIDTVEELLNEIYRQRR